MWIWDQFFTYTSREPFQFDELACGLLQHTAASMLAMLQGWQGFLQAVPAGRVVLPPVHHACCRPVSTILPII